MTFYLTPDRAAAEAAEAEIFAAFREKIRAIDPEAVAADGTLIGRNAATGELMPDASRTTGYFGEPQPAVQGWFHPQPEEQELQLTSPAATGVEVTEHLNRWPSSTVMPGMEPEPLPEWVQPLGAHDAFPLGMWVQHQGLNYESLLAANVWQPSPESNFWRVSPDPGPLPWRRPTGTADAYAIGDRVTHTVAGRDTNLWESNIAANTTEPGTDGTFDRWWRPINDVVVELMIWVQPMPGTANRPYEVGDKVLHGGETWVSTTVLNVAEPGVFGWETRQQELAALRRRGRNGQFVGDDPTTPGIDEAWLSGESPVA
jgi:hypothetical protein